MNLQYWIDKGSKAESEDALARHRTHKMSCRELTVMLADRFAEDLGELSSDEYEQALDALVDGYSFGNGQ